MLKETREPLMGFEPKTDQWRVRRATHCATSRMRCYKAYFVARFTCSRSRLNTAFCRYLTPPCISLVLLLDVPDPKSYISTIAVFKPGTTNSISQTNSFTHYAFLMSTFLQQNIFLMHLKKNVSAFFYLKSH